MNANIRLSTWLVVLTLGWLLLSSSAQAASFDCAKAQSKAEHLVCDNPELSKLDVELAASYKVALKDKPNAQTIKQAQKLWLKKRNECGDANCLRNIYQDRQLSLLQNPPRMSDQNSEKNFTASIIVMGDVSTEVHQSICPALLGLWSNGSFKRYAIPFAQTMPDELIYKVDIDNDGKVDEIRALCGNGANASCEITASLEGMDPIEFGLPATIRLLKFHRSVYIVNGVLIGHDGAVSFSNYMVHKVTKLGLELICKSKF